MKKSRIFFHALHLKKGVIYNIMRNFFVNKRLIKNAQVVI